MYHKSLLQCVVYGTSLDGGVSLFLKSLEIFGFKSFADRTRVDFSDGVTALLGPNGCGKSNVVDAIKWVLGEQATKSLRAVNMEDVIFNGTESRKALNVAEVSLTLSNESGLLDLNLTEVVVKRRIYRSGESEYFINNTSVRLKELRELFFDTGIGKSAYSIMEQGKIDQVLSNKPEERRHLFEEAAGITRYKVRGAEAERKLEKTEENMRQVEGILHEVKRSYDSLKKQSEKTKRYREIRNSLFELELGRELVKLGEMQAQREGKQKKLELLLAERNQIKSSIDGINELLESNIGELSSLEASLLEGQKEVYSNELEKNNLENQTRLFSERVSEIEHKIALEEGRSEALNKKIQSLIADNEHRQKTIEDLKKGLVEIDGHIAKLDETVEDARKRSGECDNEIAVAQSNIQDLEKQIEDFYLELRGLTDAIVSQIDKGLSKDKNQERINLEKATIELFKKSQGQIERKRPLFEDARRIGESAAPKLIEHSLLLLEESAQILKDLEASFFAYRNSLPDFLDEFLDPEGTLNQKRGLDLNISKAQAQLANLKTTIEQRGIEKYALGVKIEEARNRKEEFKLSQVRLTAQLQALEDQSQKALHDIETVQNERLESQKLIAEDRGRIVGLSQKLTEIDQQKTQLKEKDVLLKAKLVELESGIKNRNSLMVGKESELKNSVSKLGTIQESLEVLQIELSEIQTEIKNLFENFKEKHSRDLNEFNNDAYKKDLDVENIKAEMQKMRDELRDLGSVNLMAVEEFLEVKERYDFLNGQLQDLKNAREDLNRVTNEIRIESSELFLACFEEIRQHFHTLFRRMFGGGRAEVKLSDPDNALDCGIEIYAQPPGKKLENIALLSGGERSLTAVALLFATYLVKPSPFCLLDEIDAALDESNVGRFVGVLSEFASRSQFIIITHNKKTVTGAKTLLGVTMEESGVSKLVAIRLAEEK